MAPVDGYYKSTQKRQPAPDWSADLPWIADIYEMDHYLVTYDVDEQRRYLGHILANDSIMIKDSPIKLYIFFLVMTRPIQ